MRRILIVDDERNMCEALKILLESHGYSACTAADGKEAAARLMQGENIDLVISDLKMPNLDGMGLLTFLKDTHPEIPLVLITAYGTIEAAVEAMKLGAVDFITKPFNKDLICRIIDRIFQIEDLSAENKLLSDLARTGDLVFRSPAMGQIMRIGAMAADVPTPILITGESGSGKGIVAKSIHDLGGDDNRPFVAIHCPTIPETLLESELFGYHKGAFTGADTCFKGKIRLSDNGTLFLDEIADIPLNVQAKLLRVIEEKCFEPLGSTSTIKISNRVICATSRNLAGLVGNGLFRKDLFYRINTITLEIPPLRDRREDIIPLAEFFLGKSKETMQKKITGLSETSRDALYQYSWPGNVRELRNVIERAVVLCRNHRIELQDLPSEFRTTRMDGQAVPEGAYDAFEKNLLTATLDSCGGNITAAARELGISRSKMRYRMKKFGLISG